MHFVRYTPKQVGLAEGRTLFAELVGQDTKSGRRPLLDGASEARNLEDGDGGGDVPVHMIAMARGIQVRCQFA